MKKAFGVAALILAFPLLGWTEGGGVQARFDGEFGALKIYLNSYRVGASGVGSDFDFVGQGGEEILFPFQRYSADFLLGGRHDLGFLYQPLSIETEVRFRQDVTIDGTTFASGTPMRLVYGFPFYRLTYRYRFLDRGPAWLEGGAALQFRNASIRFASQDGSRLTVSQNLGLVPALALSGRLPLGGPFWASFEATGI